MYFSVERSFNEFLKYASNKAYQILLMNDPGHVAVVEVLAVVGLLIMVTGYRYLRFAMFSCGFWLAFCIFYIFSPMIIHGKYCCNKEPQKAVHIAASVGAGIILGLFTAGLYRFGVFLIGKCLGILVGMLLVHSVLSQYATSHFLVSSFVALSAIIFGSLTWRYEKPLLILSTSFLGSFLVICGIDIFTRTNFALLVISILVYARDSFKVAYFSKSNIESAQMPKLDVMNYYSARNSKYVLVWFVLTCISSLIQYFGTARDASGGGNIFPISLCTICKCLFPCCFDCSKKINEKSNLK